MAALTKGALRHSFEREPRPGRNEDGPGLLPGRSKGLSSIDQLHPLVAPQVSHFSQVPLRTIVKFWHSEHMLPV